MLSIGDFVTQVKMGALIKCNNVTERMECIEILDDVGFDASFMYGFMRFDISRLSDYLYVGVSDSKVNCWIRTSSSIIPFSEVPKDIAYNDEEFYDAINKLLFA